LRFLFLLLLLEVPALSAWGGEFFRPDPAAGGKLVLPPGDHKDVYAAGPSVDIDQPVRGCLYAAGRDLELSAPVGGNTHLAGRKVGVESTLSSDLIAVGEDLRLGPGSLLKGDLLGAGKDVRLEGTVEGRVFLFGNDVLVDGPVSGKVIIRFDHSLVLGPHCRIQGKVIAYGPDTPQKDPLAQVSDLDFRQKDSIAVGASRLSRWGDVFGLPALLRLAAWLLTAWVLARLLPKPLARLTGTMGKGFLSDMGLGILLAVAGLSAVTILLLTLVGWYLALTLGAFLATALLLSRILALFYMGVLLRKAVEKRTGMPSFRWVAGSILLLHLSSGVPWFGCPLAASFTLASLGSLARWGNRVRRSGGPLKGPLA
jgi:hypothetical protein